ncbi:hypothetical protein [Tenacibaculum maritimum]|uniref:hypothetical protein n=4 Tax=Tenacibaculum maritimum TaxID=107401 RepID=UPI0010A35520|nr:hypothetical protein [Tenacibaculum maritimum]MCD9583255.1 hypothetical protein [Tenacibaculum maritimum]MCD9637264.1 hypothetical protein [Tenacibaculum maritimum]QCD61711.1 hypothetical protein B9C57_03740 [Tenacibaculum maritimum]CAA0171009.1 hypothetical protein AQ1689_330006 [Tenacibaculum maritimum]CAA0175295.1 hypothetical protein AQ1685_340002 [Tenacibaculum maritimum]
MFKNVFLVLLSPTCLFSQVVDYSLFKGEKVKVDKIVQLDKPYLLSYKRLNKNEDYIVYNRLNDNSIEAKLTLKENSYFSIGDIDKKGLYFQLKLSFYENEKLISFIKYGKIINKIRSNLKIIGYIKRKQIWEELDENKYKEIVYILNNINEAIFWEFYKKENNPNYPEINKLKPFVKDANGVLNIEKLAKVLEENKTLLAKYLDN